MPARTPKKSLLSALVQRIQPKLQQRKSRGHNNSEKTVALNVYFEEHSEAGLLKIQIIRMTVAETINFIIKQGEDKKDLPLGTAIQYDLRYFDEDDEEVDYDLPPLSRDADIFEVNQHYVALCRRAPGNENKVTSLNKQKSLDLPKSKRSRGLTLTLNKTEGYEDMKYVKIIVPGPTETQNTIKVSEGGIQNLRVRDLYSLLNRKLQCKPYSSAYFGLYYRSNTKDAIDVSVLVRELKVDELYLLPRGIKSTKG
eukprot:UN29763